VFTIERNAFTVFILTCSIMVFFCPVRFYRRTDPGRVITCTRTVVITSGFLAEGLFKGRSRAGLDRIPGRLYQHRVRPVPFPGGGTTQLSARRSLLLPLGFLVCLQSSTCPTTTTFQPMLGSSALRVTASGVAVGLPAPAVQTRY